MVQKSSRTLSLVSTVPQPPRIDESSWIIDCAVKCGKEFLEQTSVPCLGNYGQKLFDKISFCYRGELMNCVTPIDRTLETPVMVPDAITVDFIRYLQLRLLKEWPLWRIQICGTFHDGEESIMIYPEVVRVGRAQCPPLDLEEAVGAWRRNTNEIREKYNGPERRQFQAVKARLPGLMAQLSDAAPVALAGVFDNWQGDQRQHTAWVLRKVTVSHILGRGPGEPASGGELEVDSAGNVVFGNRTRPLFELKYYTFETALSIPPFTIVLEEMKRERTWEIPVRPEDYLTDQQLRAHIESGIDP